MDPYVHTGIHEAEIATVILSEAATAREGVELLKRIVETDGIWEEGFGILICDRKEQWYVEVCTGHEFLAVLLPRSVAFFEANVSVLGLLDLDDTEHIIASDDLIGVAQLAGTFVGDAEKNIIDYRREEIMTREHMKMSEEAQTLALKLYRYLVYGEPV